MHNSNKGEHHNGNGAPPPVSALCRMSSIEEAREVIRNLHGSQLPGMPAGLTLVVRFHQAKGVPFCLLL